MQIHQNPSKSRSKPQASAAPPESAEKTPWSADGQNEHVLKQTLPENGRFPSTAQFLEIRGVQNLMKTVSHEV